MQKNNVFKNKTDNNYGLEQNQYNVYWQQFPSRSTTTEAFRTCMILDTEGHKSRSSQSRKSLWTATSPPAEVHVLAQLKSSL